MTGVNADDFFERIAAELALQLEAVPARPFGHCLLILEGDRVTICPFDADTDGMAVDSILGFHVDGGADAAAFVTPTDNQLIAQVLFSRPRSSDVRRASLTASADSPALGAWESIV